MSDKESYMWMLLNQGESDEDFLHRILMDIAWSLHIIAQTELEREGYLNTARYMRGEDE